MLLGVVSCAECGCALCVLRGVPCVVRCVCHWSRTTTKLVLTNRRNPAVRMHIKKTASMPGLEDEYGNAVSLRWHPQRLLPACWHCAVVGHNKCSFGVWSACAVPSAPSCLTNITFSSGITRPQGEYCPPAAGPAAQSGHRSRVGLHTHTNAVVKDHIAFW